MPRPRKNASESPTTDRLLVAAATAFGQHGFEATRLEDVAAAVGIRRASLLHHYESKEALYAGVIQQAFAELERTIERATTQEGDYEARLERLIDALIAFERDHLALLSVLLRGVLRDDALSRQLVTTGFAPLLDRMEAFVRRASGSRRLANFPVRAALLQVIFAHLVRSAMGKTGEALWKGDAHAWTLTKKLFVEPT